MGAVEPRDEQIEELLAAGQGVEPIVMINLLRYREQAEYPAGSDHEPCSGREAYSRYGQQVLPMIAKHGGRPIWAGSAFASPIAPEGERWDDAVLVEYPSVAKFHEMTSSAEYIEAAVHRTAALSDSRLVAIQPTLSFQSGG